jgi:hypothetical protein
MAKLLIDSAFLQELDTFVLNNFIEDYSVKTKGISKEQDEEIKNFTREHGKSFIETLNEMLKKYNETATEKLNDVTLYKKAGVTRQTYHKLLEKDRPSKDTIIMYSLALNLCENDTGKLLASAGYSFASNSKRDLMLKFCFVKKIYDYTDVCDILKTKGEKLFKNF